MQQHRRISVGLVSFVFAYLFGTIADSLESYETWLECPSWENAASGADAMEELEELASMPPVELDMAPIKLCAALQLYRCSAATMKSVSAGDIRTAARKQSKERVSQLIGQQSHLFPFGVDGETAFAVINKWKANARIYIPAIPSINC